MSDQFNPRQVAPYAIPYKKYPVEPFTVYSPLMAIDDDKEVKLPSNEDPILWRQ